MKENIHPQYQDVMFEDTTTGKRRVIASTMQSEETVEHNGKTLPLVKLSVSSYSHPLYTGKNVFVDAAGRVDKFKRRYGG